MRNQHHCNKPHGNNMSGSPREAIGGLWQTKTTQKQKKEKKGKINQCICIEK